MRFKLDENLGKSIQQIFQEAGHDVQTVLDEKMRGCSDQTVYEACCSENRCLVTLDLDFANILRFPPEKTAGIVVFRIPKNTDLAKLRELVIQFLEAIERMPIAQQVWIVEPRRIRIHQKETD
jgi:predicted nuclease of predicted toxin-antitoxin system